MPFDPVPLSDRAKLLMRARDIIHRRGWGKGGGAGPCIYDALSAAAGYLAPRYNWAHLGITDASAWNDAPGRTQAEVEDWFLREIAAG